MVRGQREVPERRQQRAELGRAVRRRLGLWGGELRRRLRLCGSHGLRDVHERAGMRVVRGQRGVPERRQQRAERGRAVRRRLGL